MHVITLNFQSAGWTFVICQNAMALKKNKRADRGKRGLKSNIDLLYTPEARERVGLFTITGNVGENGPGA